MLVQSIHGSLSFSLPLPLLLLLFALTLLSPAPLAAFLLPFSMSAYVDACACVRICAPGRREFLYSAVLGEYLIALSYSFLVRRSARPHPSHTVSLLAPK